MSSSPSASPSAPPGRSAAHRAHRELDTLRLRLTPPRPEDLAEVCALWSAPEVTRFIGGRVQTEEEVWSRILRYIGHWSVLGYGYWIIRETASGRFVGELGFADQRRPLPPPFGEAPEAGWALMPWAQGRGFASEALAAALRFADARFPEDRTVCMIDDLNERSAGLALKHGFRRYGEETYRGAPIAVYERRRGGVITNC